MKRPIKSPRRRLLCEPLEARSLMTAMAQSSGALVVPDASSSLFVRFVAGVAISREQASLQRVGATVDTAYPDGPELVSVGRGYSVTAAIKQLRADAGVVYATPDSTIHATSVANLPDDPAIDQLWGLNNSNNVDIDAPEAWGVTLGNPSTIVAVLDTGIDLNNPDFAGKIWTNPGNDAAEGYPNDVHGWNFINNTHNVQDNNGHGTHVSANIAAVGNNNYGVAGVDPSAQIMPLKFLDADGNGTTDAAVSAIYFAVSHGAKVINASWGGVDYSAPLDDAIAYANAHNVVFVTAAGNNGTDNDQIPSYPGSFQQPNELTVAAVDRFGNLASFSNYGASTVNLAAPGVDIISDVPTNIESSGLEDLSGTSMSTAYVSGVAALVSGLNPSFTATQIVSRIDATTKQLPFLAGKTISGGMVDAYNAVVGSVSTASSTPAAGLPTLTIGSSSDADVHAAILASDEFFDDHGASGIGFLTGLYQQVLGRSPDPGGLQVWQSIYNSGTMTRYQIAQTFVTSSEARLTEVAGWYQDDLGRSTSIEALKTDAGVAAWANLLLDGVGDDTVKAAIMSSAEYLLGHDSTPESVVQGYYQDLTDRDADAAGEAAWAGLLYQGFAPYNVLRMFQASPEVQETQVAIWFDEDLGRNETIAQLRTDSGVDAWAYLLGNF